MITKRTYNFEEQAVNAVKFISSYINERGYPPSVRDLSVALDILSSSTTHKLLKKCIEDGLIEVDPNIPRGIRVTLNGKKLLKKRPR